MKKCRIIWKREDAVWVICHQKVWKCCGKVLWNKQKEYSLIKCCCLPFIYSQTQQINLIKIFECLISTSV